MATAKKMARVIILNKLGHMRQALPVFDVVGAMTDAQLLEEYNIINTKDTIQIQQQEAQIALRKAELD